MQCLQVIGIGLREPSDRERDIVGNDWIHLGQEVKKGNWRLCNRVNFGCDTGGLGSLGANAWTPFQIIAKLHETIDSSLKGSPIGCIQLQLYSLPDTLFELSVGLILEARFLWAQFLFPWGLSLGASRY